MVMGGVGAGGWCWWVVLVQVGGGWWLVSRPAVVVRGGPD